jgi:hypothetical protein
MGKRRKGGEGGRPVLLWVEGADDSVQSQGLVGLVGTLADGWSYLPLLLLSPSYTVTPRYFYIGKPPDPCRAPD